ncbi:transcriptional regulator [Paramagnetospirillum marisnigri]|uniref:Transcriptional regulator n=1 Tax=Paramagnetospirillum marisnigri TaxID=1285242 RepID=A0A178MX94_9PROT|nr:BolA family protein [Paramagnetospirillum marisnigri]OAN55259.1 transcriptional regulator [Paramagnetospirillum marisnigri]
MRVAPVMRKKLEDGLAPVRLDINDDSHRHAGHAGHNHEGESHFSIVVVSDAFAGKSRVERHRMVNRLLAEELAGRVHALALTTLTPEEDAK